MVTTSYIAGVDPFLLVPSQDFTIYLSPVHRENSYSEEDIFILTSIMAIVQG